MDSRRAQLVRNGSAGGRWSQNSAIKLTSIRIAATCYLLEAGILWAN